MYPKSESKKRLAISHFFFIQCRIPACGLVSPIFMVDFPSPVKLLWKQTYPEAMYNPVKVDSESYTLMINISFLVCTLECKSAPSIMIM